MPHINFTIVTGPSGVGKTTLLKHLRKTLLERFKDEIENDKGSIPFLIMETPSPDASAFSWNDFFHRILEALKEPQMDWKVPRSELGMPLANHRSTKTSSELRRLAEQSLHHRRTKILILDEAQHLLRVPNSRRLGDQLEMIKSFASLSDVTVALVGVYDLVEVINMSAQLARRARLTEVISELTGLRREVLLQLTLASCGESIARKPLLSKQQKWCSVCLQEARQAKHEIAYPLVWQLAPVQNCPVHNALLNTRCPWCNSVQLPLMRNNRVGCCGKCAAWLGERSAGSRRPSEWELFAARESANFIHSLSTNGNGEDLFAYNLATIIDHLFRANVSACGRTIATKLSTMSAWLRRQQRPSFPSLLLLSFAFGISTYDFLNTAINASSLSEARELPLEAMQMIRPALRTHNLDEVRIELERAIAAQAFPPPSLKAVCRQLEINQSFVMRKLPELAAKVRDHHRFYLKTRKEMGEFFRNRIIESTAVEIHLEGQYPSQDRVEKRLKNGLSLRSPSAKETWRRIVNELGFPEPPKDGIFKMASAERSPCTQAQRTSAFPNEPKSSAVSSAP